MVSKEFMGVSLNEQLRLFKGVLGACWVMNGVGGRGYRKPTVGTEETLLQNDANMPSSRTRPTGNRWTPTPILSPPSSYPPMGRLSMREKLVPRGYSGEYLRYEG
ncbi:hypothetical protein V6N13_132793 [Hibiscus sabdariffa]